MSVYIITNDAAGIAKIGYRKNPLKRLSGLQVSTPDSLVLAAIIPGDQSTERQLHAVYAGDRIRGEWFKVGGQLQDLMSIFCGPFRKKRHFSRPNSPTDLTRTRQLSETETLIHRIEALAERLDRSPSTISAKVLGGGQVLADLKSGKTITLAKYERAMGMISQMEAG